MMEYQRPSDGAALQTYEYDDHVELVSDLGVRAEASVDVVDGTAIVVAGDEQYEFDVPTGDARTFIRNGVLTIEVTTDPEDDR